MAFVSVMRSIVTSFVKSMIKKLLSDQGYFKINEMSKISRAKDRYF